MAEEKTLEEQLKELKKVVSTLIEIETAKIKVEAAKAQLHQLPPSQPDKEEILQDLREVDIGELVRYAIKKNLIPRDSHSEE